jgi:hypothetical protein
LSYVSPTSLALCFDIFVGLIEHWCCISWVVSSYVEQLRIGRALSSSHPGCENNPG